MSTRVRIVVALTTCDSEAYLAQQLESIARQTRLPDALVVGDDASTDRTRELLREFARDMPFPVVLIPHQQRQGLLGNTNAVLRRCIELADVVVMADHDDAWMPEKLAVVEQAFAGDDPPAVRFSDADLIDGLGAPLGRSLFEMVHLSAHDRDLIRRGGGMRRLVHGETVTNPTLAADVRLIERCIPFPEGIMLGRPLYQQDGWVAALGRVQGRVEIDDRSLIAYRRHEASLSYGEAMQPDLPVRSQRRTGLEREQRRARLVADRVRGYSGWNEVAREEILALDRFLSARVERGLVARWRGIVRELGAGSYRRFARGIRTAAYDLVTSPRKSWK